MNTRDKTEETTDAKAIACYSIMSACLLHGSAEEIELCLGLRAQLTTVLSAIW